MALIDDPNKKLQEEEENKAGQNTNAEVVNEEPAVTKVEESAVEEKPVVAKVEEPAPLKPKVVFPNVSLMNSKERAEERRIRKEDSLARKAEKEEARLVEKLKRDEEISKVKQERKEKREAEKAEWEKQRAEEKAFREQANAVTLEDRSANALRDYGRYFRNNSYGHTFDQEQLQTSMQPEDIRAFQKKHGIPVTGWVGRRTYLKLKEEWEKANNTEEAKEKEADEAEKAIASDPTLSPAEQDLLRKDFAKNAEVRAWAKKYSSETPKDFTDEAVRELQAILNKYGYNTKNDDIFGEQTMWHFVQALETKDPELAATLKQAGITLGENGTVSVQRPYDHIMDYLNDKQDRERAMYERDYALRKSERDRKMQALNDVFSMIKDTVVASGGVKPESRDTSDKYKAIQKYAQDANEKYRKYEEDRRNKIIEMAKANEDERQRRQEKDAENKKWQQEFDERQRMNDVNIGLEKEKMQLAREGHKLKKEIAMLDAETKKAYYDIMGNYYATKSQVESVKAAQKAMAKGESVVPININKSTHLVPFSVLAKAAAKYGIELDTDGDPKKAANKALADIMNHFEKKDDRRELLEEFFNELESDIYLYNPTSNNFRQVIPEPAEEDKVEESADEAEESEAEAEEPKEMEWD